MKVIKFTTIKPDAFKEGTPMLTKEQLIESWQKKLEGRIMHKIGFHTILFPSLTLSKQYTSYGDFYKKICNYEEVELENEHIFKYHCPKEMREILK